jgi:Flagellar biosynthesis/type III secretory pathway lipoprotein
VVAEGELPVNPANASQATASTSREQNTRNYELDKEIRFVKQQGGQIVSMTAGVIINEDALRELATRRYFASLDKSGDTADGGEGETLEVEVTAASLGPVPQLDLQRIMDEELDSFRALVLTALPYNAERGDNVTISTAPFFTDPIQEIDLPWHKDPAIIQWGRHGMTSLALVAFFLLVIAPVLRAYLPQADDEEALLAEALLDGELSEEDRMALEEGESLDEIKAKLKPKKSAISADMLDTANSYDDKVAVVRLLVAEDAGRVANVLKKMIKTG